MGRRQFSQEFKLEAVWLIKERGVSVVQASRDLDVGENVLRRWIKELSKSRVSQFCFGLRVPLLQRGRWSDTVRGMVEGHPSLSAIFEPLLQTREAMRTQLAVLDKQVRDAAKEDPICRRLMTVPGVGAIVALTFRSTIDDPTRFRSSRSVGAFLGLTPKRYQSGETDRVGAISKVGDVAARVALFTAANVLLTRVVKWSALKAWGMRIAQRRGAKRAKVAVARKLAGVLHRMWVSGTDFRYAAAASATEAGSPS